MKTLVEDEVYRKCGQKDSDHHLNESKFPNKCPDCGGDHLVYARSCESWTREREILSIKYENVIPYHEARKIVVESNITAYSQAVQQVGNNIINMKNLSKQLFSSIRLTVDALLMRSKPRLYLKKIIQLQLQ